MESLSNDALIPIISEKELDVKVFIMGFHEYMTIWTPHENESLHARMEPTNEMDKFAVVVIGYKSSFVSFNERKKWTIRENYFLLFTVKRVS